MATPSYMIGVQWELWKDLHTSSQRVIFSISILFFTSVAFAEAPPVILEDGKEFYEIGLNLDILEDPSGKLTINDVSRPDWAEKFKKSKNNA